MQGDYVSRRECELRHDQVRGQAADADKRLEKMSADIMTLTTNQTRMLVILDQIVDYTKKNEADKAIMAAETSARPKKWVDGLIQAVINTIVAAVVGAIMALIIRKG